MFILNHMQMRERIKRARHRLYWTPRENRTREQQNLVERNVNDVMALVASVSVKLRLLRECSCVI